MIILVIVSTVVLGFLIGRKYIINKQFHASTNINSMLEIESLSRNPNLGVVFAEKSIKDLYLKGSSFEGFKPYML